MNSEPYAEMLKNFLNYKILLDIPNQTTWFQQNGTTLHPYNVSLSQVCEIFLPEEVTWTGLHAAMFDCYGILLVGLF